MVRLCVSDDNLRVHGFCSHEFWPKCAVETERLAPFCSHFPCSQTPVWEHISAKLCFARSYDVEFLPTWEREPHHFRRSEAGASGIGGTQAGAWAPGKMNDGQAVPDDLESSFEVSVASKNLF